MRHINLEGTIITCKYMFTCCAEKGSFIFGGMCLIVISTCVYRKVVRRASLSDRHNFRRKEYETEAIVWRGGREDEDEDEKEKESDQENNKVINVSLVVNQVNCCIHDIWYKFSFFFCLSCNNGLAT